MTFWSADEQLCHLWLQTLRGLLESLSTWASFRICCQAAQLWWHAGLSDLTQVDVMDPFALFLCFQLRESQCGEQTGIDSAAAVLAQPLLRSRETEANPSGPRDSLSFSFLCKWGGCQYFPGVNED